MKSNNAIVKINTVCIMMLLVHESGPSTPNTGPGAIIGGVLGGLLIIGQLPQLILSFNDINDHIIINASVGIGVTVTLILFTIIFKKFRVYYNGKKAEN